MIIGTFSVPRVIEESFCQSAKDYEFSDLADYFVYANTLMNNITFGEAEIQPYEIDKSLFVNDEETKLEVEDKTYCQNFLTTRYVGRAPLEFYGPKTKIGRQFILLCREGDPSYPYRYFGTEDAIRGFNRSSNVNELYPKGEGHRSYTYDGNTRDTATSTDNLTGK